MKRLVCVGVGQSEFKLLILLSLPFDLWDLEFGGFSYIFHFDF